ncbi:putative glucosidase [Phytophthora cinnamomi]|uniref:putative glucosidase n=1 Tax=Phytophthora cinnamomi TaxID=4785 RepID=UPI00355A0BCA|nr:putative glucosidase [Phytophthora cinnamomi]
MTDKFPSVVDLMESSFSEQLSSSNSGGSPAVPEELRCQYSSKRCENQRTHKKSGGLHKFCAMHREKANRNQMRLDHRRRVMKQQQKELQRQQQAQQMQQIQARQQQMQMRHSHAAAMAAGQNFHYNRMQRSPVGAMRCPAGVKPMSPPNMTISMNMPVYPTVEMQPQQPQQQQQPAPSIPLFDQHDLEILEAMLFSSDEEQSDAAPAVHCSTPQFFRSPSFVNV